MTRHKPSAPIALADVRPLHCLLTEEQVKVAHAHGGFQPVLIGGVVLYLAGNAIARARQITVDRLQKGYTGALANHEHELPVLTPIGWGAAWATDFRHDGDLMFQRYQEAVRAGHGAAVEQQIAGSAIDATRTVLQGFVRMARIANLRGTFTRWLADTSSIDSLYWAANEILARSQNASVRQRLLDVGVTEKLFKEVEDLMPQLKQSQEGQQKKLAGKRMPGVLEVLKGMVWSELSMLYGVARANCAPERARLYRPASLLGPPRRRGKAAATTPASPAAPPTDPHARRQGAHAQHPAAPAGPEKPAAPGPARAHPKGTPAPVLPTPGGATAALTPPATAPAQPPALGTATPGGGTAAPAPAAAAAAPGAPGTHTTAPGPLPVIPPVYYAGLDRLPPGTVLATLPSVGGPALQAVVQADHSLRWVPVPADTTPPATAPATPEPAPATPEPAPAAQSAPKHKRHGRRRNLP